MKLILREDVYNLGKSGELVSVKNGYARNYLLPRNLGMLANAANVRQLEHEKQVIELRQQKLKGGAAEQAKKLEAVAIKIARKVGEQDKLFGSVGTKDIEKALLENGIEIDKKNIVLEEPLKSLGEFSVRIKLPAGATAEVKVNIVPEQ